jgi:hypothetical protein
VSDLVLLSLIVLGGASQGQSFFGDILWDLGRAVGDAWIVMPSREGRVTAKDRRAHEALKGLVEKNQSPLFRERYSVVLSDKPTGLPDDYDVLMYGKWTDVLRMRMEIRVRGERAMAEMVTADGFYRGSLSAEPIDHLARQLACAFQAKHKRKPAAGTSGWGGMITEGFTSIHYVRFQRIELISRDPSRPFHLRTEPWQLTAWRVAINSNGVHGLAHTQFGEQVESLVREAITLLEPTDALEQEVLARLRRIEEPRRPAADNDNGDRTSSTLETPERNVPQEQLPLDHYDRDDLVSVETRLYARLAVYWRLEDALPELRRLGLEGAAIRLAIVTADDPADLLKAELLAKDDEREEEDDDLFEWSLDFTTRLPEAKKAAILVDVVPRLPCGDRQSEIRRVLPDAQLCAEQLAVVKEFYRNTPDACSQVAAAHCLLNNTNSDEYYRFLSQLALKQPDSAESTQPVFSQAECDALHALVDYSATRKKKRNETADIVRSLFGRMPNSLVEALGKLGRTEDADLLLTYCEHQDAMLVKTAIMALANVKPDLAVEKARGQIRKYVDGEGGFYLLVHPYLELIFWRNDRSAVDLLERALANYRKERQEAISKSGRGLSSTMVSGLIVPWEADLLTLIKYLKSETVEEQVKHALQYPREHSSWNPNHDRWFQDVGTRLIRAGADPKQCEPLLNQAPPPPFSREWVSWTSE